MRFVFVPAAWPLTVVAARIGASPNQVTALRVALILAGAVCIANPSAAGLIMGLILYVLAVIADSIDGNLSRLQDSASYFGKYFDGLVDMMADLLFPLALGIHLWLSKEASPAPVLVGAAATLALSFVFLLIHRFSMFELLLEKEQRRSGLPAGPANHPWLNAFLASPAGRAVLTFDARGMNSVFDLRYAGLAAALCWDRLDLYLVLLAFLYGVAALLFIASRIMQGYATLDVRRRSRSAA
ncbi:MAG: CDP-alcohol phosphatidyltransferase family protein [Alphaproteobacteria bacterium]|nr:CDP-alcohol phosphatidyltransferase family protein [Alphaproteobacteria bacterium]